MELEAPSPSMIARLLEEISWERAVKYRNGGRGMENVLTAEVLIALDLLPRSHFFAAVVNSCSGAAHARDQLVEQAEMAEMSLLPGDMSVNPLGVAAKKFIVQPDAVIATPNVFAFVEAKRIRTSAFQPEQLAREYVAVMTNMGERLPLLFLLGVEPPVSVKGLGRMAVHDAIRLYLPTVLERAGDIGISDDELMTRIDDVVCWIPWGGVVAAVEAQLASFSCGDPSTGATIQRIGQQLINAVEWHS
ncbi:hypothetical protein [Arthrobacter agilis]|uniref:hypothetical protein n=1 Tax=Arthrobacter agilis TaxID=37921 RepID=UPI00278695EA|nr:hypothetical protein [Arthrobacter agilis]MDQ0733797.1 hypothetical protein [Arthrobacter agilis]